ncbi:MAG: fused MFS/spermidine synthase [Actinomycetota bacterium]|nr:fused MFS/spermidine synthase [Actinomycetota bacterium]
MGEPVGDPATTTLPFQPAPRLHWSDVAARLRRPGTGWVVVFTCTLFLSAALLFAVEPMVAKMVLPILGGAPATWITSLLFFQTALLGGYAYAHWTSQSLRPRRQVVLHAVLMAASVLVLPVAVPHGWAPGEADPVPWLLLVLVVSVGLPFFVLSATGPLLQRWFTNTPHASAHDPYFLYRASNLGSMLALLAYPVLIEPRLRLADQRTAWAVAYVGLAALTVVCAVVRWRSPAQAATVATGGSEPAPQATDGPTAGADVEARSPVDDRIGTARRCRWVLLAFAPSLFMLAVTAHITTDIAAVPLLWVLPLALYLLSFIVAFAPRPSVLSALIKQAQPFLILELLILIVLHVTQPVLLVVAANLLAMFVSALVCHSRLADDRPPSGQLTEFYLWVALGGALGGVFSAVIAPLLFDSVVEYPLAIVLACLCRPPTARSVALPAFGPSAAKATAAAGDRRFRWLDLVIPAVIGVAFTVSVALGRAAGLDPLVALVFPVFAAAIACAFFTSRPVRFGLTVGAVLLAAALPFWSDTDTLYSERTFFGVLRVDRDRDRQLHLLVHGNTVHGVQSIRPDKRLEPLAYYGPAGQVIKTIPGPAAARDVAVVGLGTGSMACYGEDGQHWVFYEIDPSVERLARDPKLFTYLRDCPPKSDVVLGDARRSLSVRRGPKFGVIVVDAFNSDAIPVHLLTREAMALYLDHLADGGVILVNVTNRYLDLTGVVGDLANDAGLTSLVRDRRHVSKAEADEGKAGSMWVVMARDPAELAPLAKDPTWVPLRHRAGSEVWTDDFSNLLNAFQRG